MDSIERERWVEILWPTAREIFDSIQRQSRSVYEVSGEIPKVNPQDALFLLPRFESVMQAYWDRRNNPAMQVWGNDELDILTSLISKRIAEISTAVKDSITLAEFDEDSSWLDGVVLPHLQAVVQWVTIAGGVNSVRGTTYQSAAVEDLLNDNTEVILQAFASLDDPINEYLNRTANSGLASFSGTLLAYANAGELMIFENRRMQDFDRGESPAMEDYSAFNAFALREMVSTNQDLPPGFWDNFFNNCYSPIVDQSGMHFPGSFGWVEQLDLVDLYRDLSKKYDDFLSSLIKFDPNPNHVVKTIMSSIENSSQDFGL